MTIPSSRAPIAWDLLIGAALVTVGLNLLSSSPLAYGYLSDELGPVDLRTLESRNPADSVIAQGR